MDAPSLDTFPGGISASVMSASPAKTGAQRRARIVDS
jgi:hypothetical protein